MEKKCWRGFNTCILFAVCCLLFAPPGHSQTFTVSASPNTLTLYPGEQNVPVTVTVNSDDNDADDYRGPVVVTMADLPSGITVTPVTLTPGSSGTLMLSASPSAGQEGYYGISASAWSTTASLVGAAGATQASSPFTLTISLSNPSFAPTPGSINLPIVRIDTSNVPIIDKDTDVPGTITITSADGQTSYLPNSSDTDNTATFHLHGSSTIDMPKKPYKVKLHKSLDLLDTMGLDCGYVTGSGKATCDKSKSYILLANYDDKTLLRDWAASALANSIPYGGSYLDETSVPSGYTGAIPTPSGTSAHMPWAPHSVFVELYVNGIYEGNYQLIEKVNLDSHRININELSESDTDPSNVTGGYHLEVDQHGGEAYLFRTKITNLPIGLQDPDFSPDPEVPAQTSYIADYVNNAEAALLSGNFTDPTTGWRAYFDEASAVNFYIVNDVMGNVDGGSFFSSVYFYKDQNNPFLYMGPIWDFDISSGNVNYAAIVNPTVPWMQTMNPWYAQWFKDPGFKANVIKQWNTLKSHGVFDNWLASIQAKAETLEQSQANNNGRWPMQGIKVWPNPEAGSYDAEVSLLIDWLKLRIAYLDSIFNNKAATAITLTVPDGALRDGTPATFSVQVSGGSSPSGTVSFLANGIPLGTASLSGTSASLTISNLPAGADQLEAVYNGDDKNALSASNPQTENVAAPQVATTTSLVTSSTDFNSSTPTHLTVSVIGESGTAIPTGAVTLMSGTTSLGSATLAGDGTATFATALPVGSNSITAVYGGDAIYQGSISNAISADVVASEFSLGSSSSLVLVRGGTPGSVTLTVTPQNGFSQAVSFSCSAPGAGIACAFSPETVTPGGSNAVTTILTLSLSSQSSRRIPPLWSMLGGGIMACLLLWPFRRRRLGPLVAAGMLIVAGFAISACGSFSPTPHSATYPLTVTATSGSLRHTISMEVTVDR